MIDLNPFKNPDAIWQHILMVSGAIVLGGVIGLIYAKDKITRLTSRLGRLDNDLETCKLQKYSQAPEQTKNTEAGQTGATVPEAHADDLTIISGVTPEVVIVLREQGILTFDKLKNAGPDYLRYILQNAGTDISRTDPATWPQQARLAAQDKWDELATWQAQVKMEKGN